MRKLQKEIIAYEHVKPELDPKREIRRSVDFLKNYLKAYPFLKSFVLGISGGQDSTLTGKLCQMAISELRAETGDDSYQFIAVRLPYGRQADAQDAQDAVKFQQPDQDLLVNIKPAVDAAVESLKACGQNISDFNKGNIKARQRMIIQYAIAGANNGAVVGTDHAAENFSGFFTKYGDGASDLVPLFRLDKRQGRQLLQSLGCPKHLYEKVPTADLEEKKPDLPDEKALGVSYREIDDYLEGKDIAEKSALQIEKLWQKSEHKRHLPVTVFDSFYQGK